MIRALLAILLHVHLTTASALTLPLAINAPSEANLTAQMNRIACLSDRGPDPRPLSNFSTCIPSLFRLYATPLIHTVIVWDPGDSKKWGPETDRGGCYILVHGGHQSDVFAVESLLGPAVWAVGKCFVGSSEGRNVFTARTRVGPGSVWWLSLVLERTRVGG